jgi:hypothetical protein
MPDGAMRTIGGAPVAVNGDTASAGRLTWQRKQR